MTMQEVLESWNESAIPKDDLEREAHVIVKNSLEKQIPKRVTEEVQKIKDYESVSIMCPVCNWNVNRGEKYCRHCGQALIN